MTIDEQQRNGELVARAITAGFDALPFLTPKQRIDVLAAARGVLINDSQFTIPDVKELLTESRTERRTTD